MTTRTRSSELRARLVPGVGRRRRRARAQRSTSLPQPVQRDSFGVHDVLAAYFDGDVACARRTDRRRPGDAVPTRGVGPAAPDSRSARRSPTASSPVASDDRARSAPSGWRTVESDRVDRAVPSRDPHRRCARRLLRSGSSASAGCSRTRRRRCRSSTVRLLHGNARNDRRADAVEDVVEAVAGDRQSVIA